MEITLKYILVYHKYLSTIVITLYQYQGDIIIKLHIQMYLIPTKVGQITL